MAACGDGAKSNADSRYSRQIYAIGATAVRRLLQCKILLIGLTATGSEIAKNVLLSGCPDVTLFDPTVVTAADQESNYFLPKGPVDGVTTRADAVVPALAPLNGSATIKVIPTMDALAACIATAGAFTAAVICDPLRCSTTSMASSLVPVAQSLRAAGIPYTMVETCGLCARLFNDFGPEFTVEDPRGEDPVSVVALQIALETVSGAGGGEPAVVRVEVDTSDHPLALVDGDTALVQSSGGGPARRAVVMKRRGANTLYLACVDPTPSCDNSASNGVGAPPPEYAGVAFWEAVVENQQRVTVTEVVRPRLIAFQDITAARADPSIAPSFIRNTSDFHAMFEALHHSPSLPRLRDEADAAEFVARVPHVDQAIATVFAVTAAAELVGMGAFVGGVASQEVLKAVTRRFEPVTQFWYADQLSVITRRDLDAAPQDEPRPLCLPAWKPEASHLPMASHRAVFGDMENFKNASLFVIGAGAIGCEYLKNLALLGVGSGPKGRITLTDNDSIEVSNLSRQFLFREQHVGKNKAITAAAAVQALYPRIKIRALTEKVCRDTSDSLNGTFNARFWAQQHVICNAVDNIAAREFLDDCAVEFRRPMIDSGTEGARGHVDVFVPFATRRFRDDNSGSGTKKIPFCTLHYFPTSIDHCVQYASELFTQLFSTTPTDVMRCLEAETPSAFAAALDAAARPAKIGSVHDALCRHRPASFNDAVKWARGMYEITFVHGVKRILENYPKDKVDDDGKPYWTGARIPPTAPSFTVRDPDAVAFVAHAALLWYRVHHHGATAVAPVTDGVPRSFTDAVAATTEFLASPAGTEILVPDYAPAKLRIDEAKPDQQATLPAPAAGSANIESAAECDRWVSDITEFKKHYPEVRMNPEVFEKDDDDNGHVGFIAAAANLRARCYSINTETAMKIKKIAGRIVPAMITTTAVVTGLATMALCRLLSVGVSGTLTPGRWRQVVDGVDNSAVWLASPEQLCHGFLPSGPRVLSLLKTASGSPVGGAGGFTFTCWDRIDVVGTLATTIDAVLRDVEQRLSNTVIVEQLVEASSNEWVFNGMAPEAGEVRNFSLARWVQRFLKISDDDLEARGHLDFVMRCGVAPSAESLPSAAAVNATMPPLRFTWR